jgi:hypothetical protein
MKSTRTALFALLLLGATAGAASASVAADVHIGPSGRASVDVGFFYDDLASYGNWVERPSYGWVWTPRAAAASWRPYQDGHWVWTDQGWTWISDEPYGWATYHYGRWYDDPEIGWSWVPGNEWAPSWVSWQEGADYIGWAPLPPGVNVSVSLGGGYGGYGNYAYGIAPDHYCFVPERDFLSPRLATYIVPSVRVGGFFGRTRNFTNYRFAGGRVYNNGFPVDRVQRFAGRVPRYQVADLNYGAGRNWRQSRVEGNRVAFFRPQVQKAARVAAPPNRAAARHAVINAAQFRTAHPERIANAQRQERVAAQQRAQVRGQGRVLRQERAVQQRQAEVSHQQQRTAATQQRQAQVLHQRERATQQYQAQASRQQEKVTQQRQAQGFRQQRANQQRQAQGQHLQERANQQRQAQNFRQQERANQQRQAQNFRQQERNQQRQAQSQQRQAQGQQRQAARQQQRANAGGGPRPQRQGQQGQGQGERRHGRPPGQ